MSSEEQRERTPVFEVQCEVWVKPLFRKSRPKMIRQRWAAKSYEDLLRMLRENYRGKRWKLMGWRRETQ